MNWKGFRETYFSSADSFTTISRFSGSLPSSTRSSGQSIVKGGCSLKKIIIIIIIIIKIYTHRHSWNYDLLAVRVGVSDGGCYSQLERSDEGSSNLQRKNETHRLLAGRDSFPSPDDTWLEPLELWSEQCTQSFFCTYVCNSWNEVNKPFRLPTLDTEQ